jgi:uncharacterized damage-inducible protein DinB
MEALLLQYEWVVDSRKALLDFCAELPATHFTGEVATFAGSSMRNLLVHVSDTYTHWLGNFALKRSIPFTKTNSIPEVGDVRLLFGKTDALVKDFLEHFQNSLRNPISGILPGKDRRVETIPFMLFTHVITHEFHHKGQILSMSRHWGHIPIDTDIIRF